MTLFDHAGESRVVNIPVTDLENLTDDEIQNLANPLFPMPSAFETCTAQETPVHVTIRKYLDQTTDQELRAAITPGI